MPAIMQYIPENNVVRNHIFLTPNSDYWRSMLKLCENCVELDKKVLLLTQEQIDLTTTLKEPRSLMHLERLIFVRFKDMESVPCRIIELYDFQPCPDLIVFDMHSIVAELIGRPILQQSNTTDLVRLIAKCAAAFCNYLDMVQAARKQQSAAIAIVIMPTESYPLTQAQFKLLIGLYFSSSQLYTNFAALSERVRLSVGLR